MITLKQQFLWVVLGFFKHLKRPWLLRFLAKILKRRFKKPFYEKNMQKVDAPPGIEPGSFWLLTWSLRPLDHMGNCYKQGGNLKV